ncbi:hypothetical protein, partial [Citrobacter portucalensis]|uniref:hypothetical protein n=1 Tax=Citrobacter portucalensis TaxID=1639133 RepID=UPI002111ACE1
MIATFLAGIKTPDKLGLSSGRDRCHDGILKVDFENHHLEVRISMVVSWTGFELPVNFEHNPASLSAPPPSPP